MNIDDHSTSLGTIRLLLEATSGELGATAEVRCIPTHSDAYTVRGWDQTTITSTSDVAIDHELPLGQDVRYDVLVNGTVTDTLTVRLDPELPLLTHPIRGQHIPVTILTWDEYSRERVGHVLPIAGSRRPVIIDGLESTAASVLVVKAEEPALLDRLLGGSSLLRVRPTRPDLPTRWVSVRERVTRRFSRRPASALIDTLQVLETGQPDPDRAASWSTLADLDAWVTAQAGRPGTLQDIANQWQTLADIAFADLTS